MKFLRYVATCALGGSLVVAGFLTLAAGQPNAHTIFENKCSMCHGIDGKGYAAIKTPNFADPKWQAAHSDKELLDAIKNGVKGTAMVSFEGKLSPSEMRIVLKYIRSLSAAKKK